MITSKHTYGNPQVYSFKNDADLIIGKFCSLADCFIFVGGEHRPDFISTYPFSAFDGWGAEHIQGVPRSKGNVVIGNDVWIGHHATIMSGVIIGDGAVIGAESVVARNVAPYTIVAGNPARVIRQRFSDEDVKFLLATRWWDWPDATIKKAVPILMSGNISALRAFIESENPTLANDEPVSVTCSAFPASSGKKDWRRR